MKQLIAIVIMLSISGHPAKGETGVYLANVTGQVSAGKIVVGEQIKFDLRLKNQSSDTVGFISHRLRLYSPDSATWFPHLFAYAFDSTYYVEWVDPDGVGPLVWGHTSNPLETMVFRTVDGAASSDHDGNPNTPNLYGTGSDTIFVFGFVEGIGDIGILTGHDLRAWAIVIDSLDRGAVGKTICLDSCMGSEQGWVWYIIDTQFVPSWDGPHCFEIVADCCEGLRGNINLDPQDTIDISDLTSFVGWMFKSGAAPPCMLEADVDGNGDHDIADVTYLVGYMFKGGAQPAGCP